MPINSRIITSFIEEVTVEELVALAFINRHFIWEVTMNKCIKKLLILIGILATVCTAAYFITRFLLSTDVSSGTDADTRDGIRHEPIRRRYTKLNLD